MKWQEAKPTVKVGSGALAGAISVILVWVLSLFGIEVPGAIGAAFATVAGGATAWFVPEGSQ